MARTPTLAALEALYRERCDAFERTASAIAGESGLGQDAVHDAFVLAVRHRRRFRAEGTLAAWVWRIVVNEARKRRAERTRTPVSARAPEEAGAPRRRFLLRGVPASVVALAACLLIVLAWPFGGSGRSGVLDRALAALGHGPVLHVVREGGWGGTLVDLGSGARTEYPGIDE